jgi:hypothetical protein
MDPTNWQQYVTPPPAQRMENANGVPSNCHSTEKECCPFCRRYQAYFTGCWMDHSGHYESLVLLGTEMKAAGMPDCVIRLALYWEMGRLYHGGPNKIRCWDEGLPQCVVREILMAYPMDIGQYDVKGSALQHFVKGSLYILPLPPYASQVRWDVYDCNRWFPHDFYIRNGII